MRLTTRKQRTLRLPGTQGPCLSPALHHNYWSLKTQLIKILTFLLDHIACHESETYSTNCWQWQLSLNSMLF